MKRTLLTVVAVLVLVGAAALIGAQVMLSSGWLQARAEAAVLRATGRALTIAGPVRLGWSLTPSIVAQDVSLANPQGASRPAMLHLDRVEATVSLRALLSRRIEIERLALIAPDLLLERTASGEPNWVFAKPPPGPAAATPTAPSRAPMPVELDAVEIRDARIGWRGQPGTAVVPAQIQVPALDYAPASSYVRGAVVVNGVELAAKGAAGLHDGAPTGMLDLVGEGVHASIQGAGSEVSVTVLAPDLAALSTLAGRPLPTLRDVDASATLSPAGLSEVRVSAGAGELNGVQLVRARLAAPAMDQPVTSTAELAVGRLPVAVAANAGSLRALLGSGPIPIQVMLASGDATLSGEGSVADLRGTGLQLAVTGTVPDLAKLGDPAGVAVPPLRDVTIQARLAAAQPGLVVRGLHIASSAGDLAGDLALGLAPRPALRGTLVSQRLDLDRLALHAPSPPPPSAPPAATPAAAPAPSPAPPSRMIPDTKLPLEALRRFDADLHLAVGEAVWRGISYRAVEAALNVADGKLRLDPLTMQGPGGPMRAQLTAAAAPPGVAATVQAPGLAAGPVLALLGAPEFSPGTIDLDIQLGGSGDTPRALAATLDGHLGAAMVDGEVDNRWLAALLAGPLRAANLPAEQGGRSHVRCAAIRADAKAGLVTLAALTLDTSRLKLDGAGTLNLADETMDLHLRPQLRLGALLAVPVHVSGALLAPKVALDPGVLGPGRVGLTIGGPASADTCGPALALARGGHAGPAPSEAEPVKPVRPADLLRSLLR